MNGSHKRNEFQHEILLDKQKHIEQMRKLDGNRGAYIRIITETGSESAGREPESKAVAERTWNILWVNKNNGKEYNDMIKSQVDVGILDEAKDDVEDLLAEI